MKYDSLHHYLDVVFKGKDPSPAEIKVAKKSYWKQWFKHYRREARKQKKEFTLRLHHAELKAINAKKEEEQSISAFLYQAVQKAIVSPRTISSLDHQQFSNLQQQLMEIIHLLEELLDTDEHSPTEALIEKIESLEMEIHHLHKAITQA